MNMNPGINYFAYGSNLDLGHLQVMGVNIIKIESAILKNWKLIFNVVNADFTNAGYANIIREENSIVEGIVIETDVASIKKLDEYESFPYLYHKQIITILASNQLPIEALVYCGQSSQTREGLLPTRAHLKNILNGRAFLSNDYFSKLEKIKCAD